MPSFFNSSLQPSVIILILNLVSVYAICPASHFGFKFTGGDNVIALRRQECLLHSDGEIAMGAPFTDFSAPTVAFRLVDGNMVLGHGPLFA